MNAKIQPSKSSTLIFVREPSGMSEAMSRLFLQLPSWASSLLFHAALILLCAFVVLQVSPAQPPPPPPIFSGVLPPVKVDFKDRLPADTKPTKERTERKVPDFLPADPTPGVPIVGDDSPIIAAAATRGIPRTGVKDVLGTPKGTTFFTISTCIWLPSNRPQSGRPPRIVYLIDRSGSMTDTIDYVKMELKRSIGNLGPKSQFHVIFFSSGQPLEMPTRRLVHATASNKKSAYEFISNVVAGGRTDPSMAIKRAFAVRPDTIFILTDGEFDRAIVGTIKSLNANKKVTVNTISFIYPAGEKVLRQIAAQNHGVYRFVPEEDLASMMD